MRPAISPGHPIANALVVVAGAIIIAISLVLGFFAFILLAAMILTSAAVIAIRVWWLQRKAGDEKARAAAVEDGKVSDTVIEGEFRVLDKNDGA